MTPQTRLATLPAFLLYGLSLAACSTYKPPTITYDDPSATPAVRLPDPPMPVEVVALPQPLPLPGQLKPLPGAGRTARPEAGDPLVRVDQANAAARMQPTRAGYINAVQVYPFSDGALLQV